MMFLVLLFTEIISNAFIFRLYNSVSLYGTINALKEAAMSEYTPVEKDKRKKLTDIQVIEIRNLYEKEFFSTYEIAESTGFSQSIIWRCVSYISYPDVGK